MFPFWKMSFIFTHHTQDTKDVFHCQLFRRTFLINVVCVTGEDSQTTPEAWLQYDMQDQSPCGERGACFVHHQGVQFLRRIVLAERVPCRERWKRQDGVVSHASHLRARARNEINRRTNPRCFLYGRVETRKYSLSKKETRKCTRRQFFRERCLWQCKFISFSSSVTSCHCSYYLYGEIA